MDEEKKFAAGEENEVPEKAEKTVNETVEETVDETVEEASAAAEDADAALNAELEDLKNTFSEKYAETLAEADAGGPVIQDLEDEAPEQEESTTEESEKGKRKSKVKTVITAVVLTLAGLIALFVIAFCIGAKYLCGTVNPSKMQMGFLESTAEYSDNLAKAADYIEAIGSENDDGECYNNAVSSYESAIALCTDDTPYCAGQKKKAVETLVKFVYENEGYKAAYTKLSSNLSAEEIKKCSDKTVKKVVATAAAVNKAACAVPAEVIAKVKEDAAFSDAAAITGAFTDIPEDLKEDFNTAVSEILEAYKKDAEDDSVENKNEYLSAYHDAYTLFATIGADANELCENICAALYDGGCMYTALTFSSLLGEDYEVKTDSYKAMLEKKKALADSYSGLYENAKQAADGGKSGAELIKDDENEEAIKSILASVIDLTAEGIKAQEKKNLTLAAEKYGTALSSCQLLGITDIDLVFNYVKVSFDAGSIPAAQSAAGEFITDENKQELTEEQAAEYEKMMQVFTALDASSQIFSQYYQAYYYYGQPIDIEKLESELDATITDKSNNYDKAFAAYCKYYAASTTGSAEDCEKYIAQIKENAPDLPFVYGYFELTQYLDSGEIKKAEALADTLLDVNVADDLALSVKALAKRLAKDYKGAASIAEKGISLAGEGAVNCIKEAGVAYLLSGDYDKAYDRLYSGFSMNLTLENCDLILILNYLGKDSKSADKIKAAAEEVNTTYEQYGVTSLSDTLDILAGKKTVESVLASGSGTLKNK